MELEDYFEEVFEDEVEEVAPQPIKIPLEVQVGPVAENLASLSPPPPSPSPEVPSPPQSPVGDLPSFMGFYTLDDLTELEQWAVDTRAARNNPQLRVEEPDISRKMKVFPRVTLGQQWDHKLLCQSREVLMEQLRAYLAGYNKLTSYNRRQWLRLLPDWTVTERQGQLELLVAFGGFVVL